MGRIIAKLKEDGYVEWSSIVDAPVTDMLSRDDMLIYLDVEYGISSVEDNRRRLDRADKSGTSSLDGTTLDDLISFNRAGPKEKCLSLEQIIEKYDRQKQRRLMGCFSYKCLECGRGIYSSSFEGDHVHLFMLKKGKIIEKMTGEYNSYGAVFIDDTQQEGFGLALRESMDWKERIYVYEGQEDGTFGNGTAAIHVKCYKKDPTHISPRDPDQGWNKRQKKVKNYDPLRQLKIDDLCSKMWGLNTSLACDGARLAMAGLKQNKALEEILQKEYDTKKQRYLQMEKEYVALGAKRPDWMEDFKDGL